MDPQKRIHLTRVIARVVIIALTLFLVYAFALQPKHTALQTAGFCFSLVLAGTVLFQLRRVEK